jgi:hypothetical protein
MSQDDDSNRIDPTGCTATEKCTADGHYGNCPKFELVIPLVVYRFPSDTDQDEQQ